MLFDVIQLGPAPTRTDRHRLAGICTVDGVPSRRLVVVVDRKTINLLAARYSDPGSGAWIIEGLPQYDEKQLLVLALDDTETYNAEVADYVSQVAGV